MANAMLLMMEAMGEIASSQKNNRNFNNPRSTYSWPPKGETPYYPPQPYELPTSILEGTWQGTAGDILIIHGMQFRIFISPEQFTEGLFQIQNQLIAMLSQGAQYPKVYEYALKDNQLALRDKSGQVLLYRLTSRQAPPTPFGQY